MLATVFFLREYQFSASRGSKEFRLAYASRISLILFIFLDSTIRVCPTRFRDVSRNEIREEERRNREEDRCAG